MEEQSKYSATTWIKTEVNKVCVKHMKALFLSKRRPWLWKPERNAHSTTAPTNSRFSDSMMKLPENFLQCLNVSFPVGVCCWRTPESAVLCVCMSCLTPSLTQQPPAETSGEAWCSAASRLSDGNRFHRCSGAELKVLLPTKPWLLVDFCILQE